MTGTAWTTLSIVSILGWLVLVVPGLAGRGLTVSKTVAMAVTWIAIFGAAYLLFAHLGA
jgi:hypothetical protein